MALKVVGTKDGETFLDGTFGGEGVEAGLGYSVLPLPTVWTKLDQK